MADHFYCRDQIRRKFFLHISDPHGIFGWSGVAALRDACLVARALLRSCSIPIANQDLTSR